MIKTALTHAFIAIVMQVLLAVYLQGLHGFDFNNGLLAGGFAACCGFLFREIAQHEYKGGGPLNVGMLYGLKNHWTLDSILDVLLPTIATGALWYLMKSV